MLRPKRDWAIWKCFWITAEQFRDELTPILQAKGWWGKTADGKFLGTPWRLKTIFQTNLRVSAAQGEWASIQEVKEDMPYLRYTAILDKRTRPLHASWQGIILSVDHPWWKTHFPPNGWNCRCKVLQLDDADLAYHGWKVTENPPNDGSREWINPATGEIVPVPNGIDPGWAYNPGEINQAAESAKIAVQKKEAMQKQAVLAIGPAWTPVVQPVTNEQELADQIKKHVSQFCKNGPITNVDFKDASYFMCTNLKGHITISTRKFPQCGYYHPSEDLKNAWNSLTVENGKRSFFEEEALQSLWHEIIHNREVISNLDKPGSPIRNLLEVVTEWVARRTYPDFIKALGGKAIYADQMKTQADGYARFIKNFDLLLDRTGITDKDKMLMFLETVIQNLPFPDYRKNIAKYIASTGNGKGSSIAIGWLLKSLDDSQVDFEARLKRLGL